MKHVAIMLFAPAVARATPTQPRKPQVMFVEHDKKRRISA